MKKRLDVAAVVLAGGLSSRMGAQKAFVPLAGRPLIAHVVERLGPQADRIYINAREEDARHGQWGARVVTDPPGRLGAGPLAGVAAALALARLEGFAWLVTAPCDAPFLPLDLVSRLMAPIEKGEARAAVAFSDFGLEPMFALWPTDAGEAVEAALNEGRASPREALRRLGAAQVVFAAEGGLDPFANLNTPAELAKAEAEFHRQAKRDENPRVLL